MAHHTLHISWTHCASCEVRIRQAIKRHGCQCLSFSSDSCTITGSKQQKTAVIEDIRSLGYDVSITPTNTPLKRKKPNPLAVLWRLGNATVLVMILLGLGWTNTSMVSWTTLWWAIVLGLLASCSTCLAVTWWLVMSYSTHLTWYEQTKTQIMFHLGRITMFGIVWLVLGYVWSVLVPSITTTVVLNTIVAILLVWLGLQWLGWVPPLRSLIPLPSFWTRMDTIINNSRFAPLLGALTVALPCWFTQSMMLVAISTQTPLLGAWLLTAFALGTTPVLLGLGRGSTRLKDRLRFFIPALSATILAFGMYSIINTASLAQAGIFQVAAHDETLDWEQAEIIEIGHDGVYFSPNRLELNPGELYRLRVTPENNGQGCMGAVVYAGKTYPIRKGETFDLLIDGRQPWNHRLVCASMGMIMGEIVIK